MGEENGRLSFDDYEEDAERFESDTRRYLMEHLLDEYESVGVAVSYNLLQNAVDNRASGVPLVAKFSYSTADKRFRFICGGTKGVEDWDRYNSLHREGPMGISRRGEGAKVLVPISESVRTETRLASGQYQQAIWREDRIWRSDRSEERKIFDDHFPPTAIPAGTTMITAERVFDEVGDRKAGSELANLREMVSTIQRHWWLYLLEHPDVTITYEVDGTEELIGQWEMPELVDQTEFEHVELRDAAGKIVGVIEKMHFSLAKAPLRENPPAALAISTGTHIVTYLTLYGGPNSSKCFGYVKAPFLQGSEQSNHFSFKSTRQYRLLREKISGYVNEFMRKHVGTAIAVLPRNRRAMGEVTDDINQLIRERFPDWHPEGGFIEKRKKPAIRKSPWIYNPKTSVLRLMPGEECTLSFEVLNPDKTRTAWTLKARATTVGPDASQVRHLTWDMVIPMEESKNLSDIIQIPGEGAWGTYTTRISLVTPDEEKALDDRRITFEVGEEVVDEEETKLPTALRKNKRRKAKKGGAALADPGAFNYDEEEDGSIVESFYAADEGKVYFNLKSPSYELAMEDDMLFKYHVAKCEIQELAKLKFQREISLLEPDEMTKDRLGNLYQELQNENATFMAHWAKRAASRLTKAAMEPADL